MFLDLYMDYFYIHQYLLNKNLQSIRVNKYIFLDHMYHIYMDYLLNKLYFEFLFYHMNNSMDKNIDNHQVNFHMLHLKNMVMMHNNFVFEYYMFDLNNLLDKHNENYYYNLYEYKFRNFHMDYFDTDQLKFHKNVLHILRKKIRQNLFINLIQNYYCR
jgi:hypothetical protein